MRTVLHSPSFSERTVIAKREFWMGSESFAQTLPCYRRECYGKQKAGVMHKEKSTLLGLENRPYPLTVYIVSLRYDYKTKDKHKGGVNQSFFDIRHKLYLYRISESKLNAGLAYTMICGARKMAKSALRSYFPDENETNATPTLVEGLTNLGSKPNQKADIGGTLQPAAPLAALHMSLPYIVGNILIRCAR